MLVFAFLSHRWQHLPRRLRDLLAEYVGQHTLIIAILSGVTDTHISIYINKWSGVWIQMMYHEVWMMSDKDRTTNAEEHEVVGDRRSEGAGIVTQNKPDSRTQQSPCLLRVNLTTLIACVWGCSSSDVFFFFFFFAPCEGKKERASPGCGFSVSAFKGQELIYEKSEIFEGMSANLIRLLRIWWIEHHNNYMHCNLGGCCVTSCS